MDSMKREKPSFYCVCLLLIFTALCLSQVQEAGATAIANSDLSFFNLQITPDAGTVDLLFDWELEAFAEAKNSLGELDQDYDFSLSGGTVSADAMVTWADGHGDASAPTFFPPDLSVTGNAASNVNCPGCKPPKAASSLGRGSLFNEFVITGGLGTVDVDFSANLLGDLFVFTDKCGVFAKTEVIFGLELDGNPILFHHDLLAIGPNSLASLPVSEALFTTVPLEFDVPYFLYLEVDSESAGAVVPEPATWALMLVGLGCLIVYRRKRRGILTQ